MWVIALLLGLVVGLVVGALAAWLAAAARNGGQQEQMAQHFELLSRRALHEQTRAMDAQAGKRLQENTHAMEPVTTALQRLDERLREVEKGRAEMAAEMRTQISGVQQAGENLRKETSSLVTALRKPQVRGVWGENQLRRVVESAGMSSRCDFTEQVHTATDDGPVRPDMVVHLAGGRRIVVDSKAPLEAFLSAASVADDEDARQAHLAQYAVHIKNHVKQLGSKEYWRTASEAPGPEFVVLFLPGEAFYQAALEQVPDLCDFAMSHQVVVASPFTLIALLRTVALGWRQQAIMDNAQEIATLGRELHRRLRTLGSNVNQLGNALTKSVSAYNAAVGSLESRVMVTARKFAELDMVDDDLTILDDVAATPRELVADKWDGGDTPDTGDTLLTGTSRTPAGPADRPVSC